MIPALMLAVKGHHAVLDVCAAPGSKTEQLLHLVATNGTNSSNTSSDVPCTGMVVANDADPVRITTLKNRYMRCLTPHLLITCATAEELRSRLQQPVFDRILADVPCSGDGTIRKFPHIWRLFRPRMSLDLHKVQLSIARASVEMLKPNGGRMVYSTCSLNPLEDEAVVCALLQLYWHRGLRLVDTGAGSGGENLLPGLHTRAGLSDWRCDPAVFVLGETVDAVRKESLARLPELVESMQPPSAEAASRLHLERCHRILPQDNDTGGFFVAVLELQDCQSIDPVELEYFRQEEASSSSSSSSKKKKKKTVKESITSVNVMKELGYNPKRKKVTLAASAQHTKKEQKLHKAAKKKDDSHSGTGDNTIIQAPQYRVLSSTTLKQLSGVLDVHLSLPSAAAAAAAAAAASSHKDPSSVIKTGKTTDNAVNESESVDIRLVTASANDTPQGRGTEGVVISLVSASVQLALQTWAQRSGGDLSSSSSSSDATAGILVHAGAPIATATATATATSSPPPQQQFSSLWSSSEHEVQAQAQGQGQWALQDVSLLADGISSLRPWLRASTGTTATLSSADFRALARMWGAEQGGEVRLTKGSSVVETLLLAAAGAGASGEEGRGRESVAFLQVCC